MTLLALIAVALATGFATMLVGDRPRRRLSLLIAVPAGISERAVDRSADIRLSFRLFITL